MNGASASRQWLWATVVAVAVVAGGLMLFRGPRVVAPPGPAPASRGVSVKLGANPALHDEAAIFDPTPLFLPTEHNAAPARIQPREQGSAFKDFPAKTVYSPVLTLDALALPKPVAVPRDPAEAPGAALALPTPGPLALGMGRIDAPMQPVTARGAYVEITAASGGRQVWAHALAESARPPGNGTWQPLEFLAAVDPAGLVGPLVLTTRSGVEEVDAFFQNYLARTLRVGERLAPGFYRISVGP